MDKIIISKSTHYDKDKNLFYKFIGLDDSERTLLLTVWGKTEHDCGVLATAVMEKMSK